jgi:peroxiredoxin
MQIFPSGVAKLDEASEEPLKVGDKAPNFTYVDQQNQPVSLADFAGRPVVLYVLGRLNNYLTTQKFERLVRLAPGIERTGAAIMALSTNYWEANRDYAKDLDISFPILDNELNLEGVATYSQPNGADLLYPVYVIRPDQTIGYIKTGDDIFDENHAVELMAAVSGVASSSPVQTKLATPVTPTTPVATP